MTGMQRWASPIGEMTEAVNGRYVLASDAEAAIAAAELAAYQVGHEAAAAGSLTHACPPSGSGIMPCCGRTPFDVPRDDRMTLEPSRVTCNAYEQGQRDMLAKCITVVDRHSVNAVSFVEFALDAVRRDLSALRALSASADNDWNVYERRQEKP